MGSVLCEHCTATCCRYLALPIDKPTSRRDYDDIRWYLMHDGVTVFVEDGDWYIQYRTTCKMLGGDNLCTVYETRPEICREYEADGCDYAGGSYGYDHHFTHAKQIEAFYFKKTGKKLGVATPAKTMKRRKSAKKKKKKTA
jgi:Fe-S-cluster containining protein